MKEAMKFNSLKCQISSGSTLILYQTEYLGLLVHSPYPLKLQFSKKSRKT